jgi:CspA family cold shock protein
VSIPYLLFTLADVTGLVFSLTNAKFKAATGVKSSAAETGILPDLCCTHDRALRRETTTKEVLMPTGTVKWFNTTKGFGFIAPDSGGKDVFVHISAVERAGMTGLADNQKVSYELIEGRDGRQSAGELKAI